MELGQSVMALRLQKLFEIPILNAAILIIGIYLFKELLPLLFLPLPVLYIQGQQLPESM